MWGSGTLIRHAFFIGMAQTVVALMIAMIHFTRKTLLMASICFTKLAATRPVTTRLAAVALSAVTVAADVENFAAPLGAARPLTEDEFQGGPTVLSRR